jgi:hypothetical protein
MAKGKRAVALFEVINAGKNVPKKSVPKPRPDPWWRRFIDRTRRATSSSVVARDAAHSKIHPGQPAIQIATPASREPEPDISAKELTPAEAPSYDQAGPSSVVEKSLARDPSPSAGVGNDLVDVSDPPGTCEIPDDATVEERPVDVRVDRNRQLITFRFSYTSAAVASFAILVVIGMAYVVGRHSSRSPSSDDPFFSAPLRADVLEVTRPGNASGPAPDVSPRADVVPPNDSTPPARLPNPPTTPPTPTATNGRVIGLNYVVVQSFADEKLAREAQQMLSQAGIETTIERGLPNYAGPTWHCVVGTRGFESSVGESHPDYARYVASIREVGRQFAARTRSKEFVPQRYKWREVR